MKVTKVAEVQKAVEIGTVDNITKLGQIQWELQQQAAALEEKIKSVRVRLQEAVHAAGGKADFVAPDTKKYLVIESKRTAWIYSKKVLGLQERIAQLTATHIEPIALQLDALKKYEVTAKIAKEDEKATKLILTIKTAAE